MQPELPTTHHIDVVVAMATLDFIEMVALSEMYERWAFTEPKLDGDQRTKLIQWSCDYERIAEFCGQAWKASAPEVDSGAIAFVARLEARARGLYSPQC
jgi:hypothetical protein